MKSSYIAAFDKNPYPYPYPNPNSNPNSNPRVFPLFLMQNTNGPYVGLNNHLTSHLWITGPLPYHLSYRENLMSDLGLFLSVFINYKRNSRSFSFKAKLSQSRLLFPFEWTTLQAFLISHCSRLARNVHEKQFNLLCEHQRKYWNRTKHSRQWNPKSTGLDTRLNTQLTACLMKSSLRTRAKLMKPITWLCFKTIQSVTSVPLLGQSYPYRLLWDLFKVLFSDKA